MYAVSPAVRQPARMLGFGLVKVNFIFDKKVGLKVKLGNRSSIFSQKQ